MAGISSNFDVEIDAPIFAGGLGGWTAVEGLGWDIAVEDREEGGNIFNKVKIPGLMNWTNIKLTRVVDGHSPQIMLWFAMAAQSFLPCAIVIKLYKEGFAGVVCTWTFNRCIPVRYTGPSMNVSGPKVTTETIEFAHHGPIGGPIGGAVAMLVGGL